MRRVAGQQFMRAPGELVALSRLGPDGQQAHPGGGHPERQLGVGHAQLSELNEHLGLGIRGRTRVDQHRAARPGRQHDRESWPEHAGQRPQPEPGGRHDPAGGAGRYDRGRLAPPDQLARDRDARPGAAQAGQRAFLHREGVLSRHHVELVSRPYRGQRLPQARRGPGQEHADAVLALRRERSGDDLVRGVIAAHGVDRDDRTGTVQVGSRRLFPGAAAEVARPRVVAGIPGDRGPGRAQRVTGACDRG